MNFDSIMILLNTRIFDVISTNFINHKWWIQLLLILQVKYMLITTHNLKQLLKCYN